MSPGQPYPLGATWDDEGVNFALFSENATGVEQGNNNAYCQDNEISWFDWASGDETLLEFTRGLIRFRKEHPVLRRRRWFQGRPIHGTEVKDIAWFTPDGQQMTEKHWGEGFAKSIGVFLNGEGLITPGPRGERIVDASFYLIFNAHHETLTFALPKADWGQRWVTVLDTPQSLVGKEGDSYEAGHQVAVEARSCLVRRRVG